MPTRPRRPPYVTGHYYHLYNRGRSRLPIFHEPRNYIFVLQLMKEYAKELAVQIIAYCLLPNHYHWLVRQDDDHQAGLLPQRVFNRYSKAYNNAYRHSGTLFEGPYQVRHVDDEGYLLHLCRYIHGNPVRHGIVAGVEGWDYSNYHEWIGSRQGRLVDREFVQTYFGSVGKYKAFVQEYLADWKAAEEEIKDYLF